MTFLHAMFIMISSTHLISSPSADHGWTGPLIMYQSIPSLTIPPTPTPGDSHILVAPGVGFMLLCLALGSSRGGGILNQNENSTILKTAIFAWSLKQMSRSSFRMFIYARSEQCDLIGGPTYLLII